MSLHQWTYPLQLDLVSNRIKILVNDWCVFVSPYPNGGQTILCGKLLEYFDKSGESYCKLMIMNLGVVEVPCLYTFSLDEFDLIRSALNCTLSVLNYEYRQMAAIYWADWDKINVDFRDIIDRLCPMDEMLYYTGGSVEQVESILTNIISGRLDGVKPRPSEVDVPSGGGIVTGKKVKSSFNKGV